MMFDENHHPIAHPVYKIAFLISGVSTVEFLHTIEPWAHMVFVDNWECAEHYIKIEQPVTNIDLSKRIFKHNDEKEVELAKTKFVLEEVIAECDIILSFSQSDFLSSFEENMNIIQNLSSIIETSAESNTVMELGIFKLTTHDITDYRKNLIKI